MSPRFITLIAAAFLLGGAVALGFFALNTAQAPQPQIATGKVLIGGPFNLTDHNGRRVTEMDFAGKHKLIFFGYTYCPDICPAELQVMSAALDALGDKAKDVTPIFITIDPERDTAEQMKSYVENFHPQLIGLTGSPEEIREAAKAYRVYYAKSKSESATDYLMDHSSIVYLMSPDGQYLAHFAYGTGPEKMADGIRKFL